MEPTMSGWVRALKTIGREDLASLLHTDKFEDTDRLLHSGLPTLDHLKVAYADFNEQNQAVMGFLSKYEAVVIRAVPRTPDLPRQYLKGLVSLEECLVFLKKAVKYGSEHYDVLLTNFCPEVWSGIIISNEEKTLIEIAKETQDKVAHGEGNASVFSYGLFDFHGGFAFRSMRYSTEDVEEREKMWWALQFIRERDKPADSNFPDVRFRKGYFEFLVDHAWQIKFVDYKLNELYLKL